MTAQHQTENDSPDTNTNPDWIVKTPTGYGRKARLERIGVAWNRDKGGGICIRTSGTQFIADDIYLFPIETEARDGRDS